MRFLFFSCPLVFTSSLAAAPDCEGRITAILSPVLLPIEAPQGITIDLTDGSLWIVSAISTTVLHVGPDLKLLGSFESPFASSGRTETGGIAYRPDLDTLLISQPVLQEIREVEKDGTPTGLVVPMVLPPPVNIIPRPYAKGLELDPGGDGGRGSLWVIESVMSAVYELSLEGVILRSFCAPDDHDGCPGQGAASSINDVGLFFDRGALSGLEVTGGSDRRNRLLRLDLAGGFGGVRIPLDDIGGRVGGFARGRARDPVTGDERDALFVTVESSAELQALAVEDPAILPIDGLTCETAGSAVHLAWRGFGRYDAIRVLRGGETIGTLAGEARSFEDLAPPDGIVEYEIAGANGACETRARCQVVAGAGQVIHEVLFEGYWAVDITEDPGERLWVSDAKNQIVVYDKDLSLVTAFPGPFQDIEDQTSGLAFNAPAGTCFVYNATTNEVAEINDLGEVVTPPFPSGVPSDPEDEATVPAMLFNPAGAGGTGSFWYLDYTTGTIQERDRGGVLLSSCLHPDAAAEAPPPKTFLDAYAFGMCEAPGSGFAELYVPGGRVRDLGATRILRIDARTCEPRGEEIPSDGVAAGGPAYYLGVHRTGHAGKPVLYVVASAPYRSRILEVEIRAPAVPHLRDLECSQPGDAPQVLVAFTNPGGLDGVELRRDGAVVATLPGSATTQLDPSVPPGPHTYEVLGLRGGSTGDGRTCAVQVGPGSIAAREFAAGLSFVHAVTLDPVGRTYVAASSSNRYSDSLHRFDEGLHFLESFSSPFPYPLQVAALAARVAGGTSELYCLGWSPGAPPGTQLELPLRVTDAAGRVLRQLKVAPPRPRGNFVTFPSGMAWDAATDTFWYLERNAFAVVNMGLDGATLGVFPHPAPLHQDGVHNFGIAIDGARNAIYLSSADRLDLQITKLVEVTRSGALTGVEVPVGWPFYSLPWGFTPSAEGTGFVFVAGGGRGAVWDLVRLRAFGPVGPVLDLRCDAIEPAGAGGAGVRLAWENIEAYDEISVFRGTELGATLGGASSSYEDAVEPAAPFYRVVGRRGGLAGAGAICEPDLSRPFVRGDVEENGQLNITDAIAVLVYLFSGGATPRCLDAADVNDSGDLNITDAISLLGYLFSAGREPAAPFPEPGRDPTADGLRCGP